MINGLICKRNKNVPREIFTKKKVPNILKRENNEAFWEMNDRAEQFIYNANNQP